MARIGVPSEESPWGHGSVASAEKSPIVSHEKEDDIEKQSLMREVSDLQNRLKETKEERDDTHRELLEIRAELKKSKNENAQLKERVQALEEKEALGESGLKKEAEEKIKESDAAINDRFSTMLLEQAREAIHNPSKEAFLNIKDKATAEVVLEEWKNKGVIPEEVDIEELADLPENERAVAIKYLEFGGGLSAENNESAPKQNDESESSFADLIHGTPPAGRTNEWEIARSVYVHDVDKQEIGGLLQATIGNIDSMFLMKVDPKDREWIRKRIRQELEGIDTNTDGVVLSKMGLKKGDVNNLRSGVDVVNLLPVFANEAFMAPVIKDAETDREAALNNKEMVVKLLKDIVAHAKRTKSAL